MEETKDWKKELHLIAFSDKPTGVMVVSYNQCVDFIKGLLSEKEKELRKEFEKEGWKNQKCRGCGSDVSYCEHCNHLWQT